MWLCDNNLYSIFYILRVRGYTLLVCMISIKIYASKDIYKLYYYFCTPALLYSVINTYIFKDSTTSKYKNMSTGHTII